MALRAAGVGGGDAVSQQLVDFGAGVAGDLVQVASARPVTTKHNTSIRVTTVKRNGSIEITLQPAIDIHTQFKGLDLGFDTNIG